MRQALIELLNFPRYQLRSELELQDCVHAGRYDASDPGGLLCLHGESCRWLYDNDEFASLLARPVEQLFEALSAAVEHVDSLVLGWGHDARHCPCDACQWLRQARQLARDARVMSH